MKCGCNCSAKCGLLGNLEQKIMEVIWQSSKPLRPAEVLKKLGEDYAYTTIMTVLKRMADKKILTRRLSGNTFLYSASQNKESYACHCLDDLFQRVLRSYGSLAITSFTRISKSFKN